ncbi:UDP-3-O-(3-hydroxymyristoyl)glucosamine N-acyltransferase [Idiomarina sp. OT37-5b]|jgi:UDP-3-O-[3-hydroxymyristoyl] glucosamine N-acyltransferase|uniref:UDP-3-O-acylglucosamine N-acyltransferase n=1 Tax=Idiomarina aquatica TaxID=1327752 RepID=A0AA94EGM2_9GAMM|nr:MULTISPECIES: UDP-3-O-(3-hydroxymyristoyl)glucosamine N-acyltransferase [Idiomarina]AVJ55689.1 UDP-3-O-(3-hydroxymyristoyl)glucosamine N-acyltransferase [Idiomarina sp. OT37-5b]RUO44698.1 UDP-3-O-(3-hydroxymyristoyl)glucosamine N-acyltransferase [Idiomarina aquatica]
MTEYTLQQLAEHVGGEVRGDANLVITGVGTLQSANAQQVAFLANSRYKSQLAESAAGAVLLSPKDAENSDVQNAIVIANPYAAFAKVAQLLDTTPLPATGIADTARVAEGVTLGSNVSLGEYVVIEAGATIGDNVSIGAHTHVGPGVSIGNNSKIWSGVHLYHNCQIGADCIIHSGAVIGADGFGWAPENGKWLKIPQIGRVVIGNRVEIGASTTVDRGALDDTIISDGCIIDNQCQIAHNVFIDEDTAIAGCTVLAGSCRIGKRCMIGGASAINGHISICDDVQIMGFAMVIKEITEPGVYASGIPASSHREWRRNGARFRQLDDLFKRVKSVEQQLQDNNE